VDEEAYLNELVAYQLQFEGYKYDHFSGKLVKVPIIVSQKFSPVEVTTVATSSTCCHYHRRTKADQRKS
jgi:hypothetical protein